jgi:uncharacterized LabA/DUF88 family protein
MIFVDGTNLIYRLKAARLRVPSFDKLWGSALGEREKIVRSYFYTSEPHRAAAFETHGAICFDRIRVVLGTAVPLADGNYKEKGVDALLVADLIYHAAARNCDSVTVVSTDVDFVHALRRVEDFGCSIALVSICADAPPALRAACDRYETMSREHLLERGLAEETSPRSART